MKKVRIKQSVTNWRIESVYRYLVDISKLEGKTREEENELSRKIKQGDQKALEDLVKANLRFVISVAKQYQGQGLFLDDLIAEGNAGLLVAAKQFDPDKGIKFISYAVWWIRQSIMFACAKQSRIVELPMNKINNIGKINKIMEIMEQKEERPLSKAEVEDKTKQEITTITKEDFYECYNAIPKAVSLDAKIDEESIESLGSLLPNTEDAFDVDKVIDLQELKTNIDNVLKSLHVIERDIVRWEYQLRNNPYRSKTDLMITYKLSEQKYDAILKRAINKLKKYGRSIKFK